ncbi:hypothetical protein AVENLUH5627_03142 [Acinetobacter venetianus]|uniref:Protein FilF n=1 Tax=Acinetobacter venetianus TaxID=52133 RepID=A0A150HL14_9GAMM|nr:hypothetical protein [Acinetobacter venetianus]KXZ64075.1 hypothetical protein AVENLUH5627_03142 [Acinetobacter venetianus]
MNKKIILPFALSTFAALLTGCGGESAKINEDPTKGVTVTKNGSCDVNADDCLQFTLDYPVAGLNFDCSGDKFNHFATKLQSNIVTGACKLGDDVSFYIQGENARKISLGTVKLDNISKLKVAVPSQIRLIDIASGLTGKEPNSLSPNDETVNVAIALVRILQSIGAERGDNVIGDLQPTELTTEKKNQLEQINKDLSLPEFTSGEYIDVLKPWVDVTSVSNEQAFIMLKQLLNLTNSGVLQADLPVTKGGGESISTTTASVRPDGFFGCNKEIVDCVKTSSNLRHSMGNFLLLSDRQGYTLGYGQQWRGAATVTNNLVVAPYVLVTKVKPIKMQVDAQNEWLEPINREIQSDQPLRFNLNANVKEDLLIKQGRFMNGYAMAGTEALYKQLIKAKEDDVINNKHLGLWEQNIDGEVYKGTIDIIKVNPSSYLEKDIFRTEANVKSGQNFIFPLYATLTFKFSDNTVTPNEVNLGIMIDEYGDIRTDIKKDATATDMSGNCASTKSVNDNGTVTDEYGEVQYRIGTTGATLFSTYDKSITVRMILSNLKFGAVDGAMFGLNLTAGTGAKINIHNLLQGQATGITLTNFSNNTVTWNNTFAAYQLVYNELYDDLSTEDKNKYVAPTDAERELAKRFSGTVSIKIADQNIPACKAIKTKS